MNSIEKKTLFKNGISDGIPICLGYVSVAFAFGIFTVNAGLYPWQAVLISMTNCTSAGQLAGVPIIAGGLSFAEMALSQLIINLRYALMSISLSQKVSSDVSLKDRFLIAFVNTDEVFAVASGKKGLVSRYYFFGLILTPYFGWAFGTALGALAGNILPQIITNSLGIAIYGMFIAIIVPASKKSKNVFFAVCLACVLSIVLYYVPIFKNISSGFAIIICAVIASSILALVCPLKEEQNQEESK